FFIHPPHPTSTLFPYTTLFRFRDPEIGRDLGPGQMTTTGHRDHVTLELRRDFLGMTTSSPPDHAGQMMRQPDPRQTPPARPGAEDRKSTRPNSSHLGTPYGGLR